MIARRNKTMTALMAGALVTGLGIFTSSGATLPSAAPSGTAATVEHQTNNPVGADEWLYRQRANADGTIPYDAVAEATALSQQMDQQALDRTDGTAASKWKLTGPSNIGGRVRELAPDPTKAGVVYVAAATGGIWKSTDSGKTLTSSWKSSYPQSMGAVAVDKNGVVWAGTGEPDNGGGSAYYGDGIYRSTDHGATWEHMGLDTSGSIGHIAIDPKNPDRIFVAAQGRLHDTEGNRGLFLTTDGGKTWNEVLKGLDPSVGAIDVAIDPGNSDIVLVTTWDKIRDQVARLYGKGSKLYRSTDGGKTWKDEQKAPLPVSYDDPGQPVTATYVGRMGIAFAPSDPQTVYLISSTAGGNFNGFFMSKDAGDTWKAVGPTSGGVLQTITGGFAWWFGRVWVDPKDAKHVFLAGVSLAESKDGGQTWATTSSVHADQHALAWDPNQKDRVYLGNDGGFYRSDNNGAVGSPWVKTPLLPATQFYSMDTSLQHNGWINGGAQDNNSLKSWDSDGTVDGTWNAYVGGDGMMNRIDPNDDGYYYGCSQYGGCLAFTPKGSRSIAVPGSRQNWVAPLEFKNTDTKVLYSGSEAVNRINMKDANPTWETISPDLTGGADPRNPSSFATVTAIGSGFKDAGLIYAGTDDGRLWVTYNGDSAADAVKWTQITGPDIPQRWVTRVTVSPYDDDQTVATFSGWKWGSFSPHVVMTKDEGKTWTDISGNLPQAPVNDVVWSTTDKKELFVATDLGVYRTRDLGKHWTKVGANLPDAPVLDIDIQPQTHRLFAATFGRSIWQTNLSKK